MKLSFCADVHIANHRVAGGSAELSLNERCRAALAALFEAALSASVAGSDVLVVCGDVFDGVRPEPQVQAAVAEALLPMRTNGRSVVLLAGNHDIVSSAPGDHALAMLAKLPGIIVVDAPTALSFGGVELLCVPFQPGAATEWFSRVVADVAAGTAAATRVLAVHLGISDGTTPPYLRDAHDSVPATMVADAAQSAGVKAVYAGNWHWRQEWAPGAGPVITQCGTLAPVNYGDSGTSGVGWVHTFDTDTGQHGAHQVPGPRFSTLHCDAPNTNFASAFANVATAIDKLVESAGTEQGGRAHVRAHVPPDMLTQVAQRVQARYGSRSSRKLVVEVLPLLADTGEQLTAATAAARSASTLTDALRAFVNDMPVADGVDREAVLDACSEYLGVSGGSV